MTVVVVALDTEAAEFVRLALAARRRSKGAMPPGLILATGGHDQTRLADASPLVDDAGVATLLLTKTQAATELGVSPKTVQRLTASGQLPTVRFGGRSMIRRSDMEAHVAKLSPIGSPA